MTELCFLCTALSFIVLHKYIKLPVFGRTTFSYSAIHPSFDINFPWSLGYIRKLALRTPWGNYFSPVLCAANIRHLGMSNLQDTVLSGCQFTAWLSGASEIHFLCPEKFTLGQCRLGTWDLSFSSQMSYHWTNMPHLLSLCIVSQFLNPIDQCEQMDRKTDGKRGKVVTIMLPPDRA